jgi:hypothetical protein
MHTLHGALRQESLRGGVEGGSEFQLLDSVSAGKGVEAAVGFVSPCVRVVPGDECVRSLGAASTKCVDIEVQAFSVRINTANPLRNVLDNSRSNSPTLFSRVPAPLLAFNPEFGTNYDRRYGTAGTLGTSSNLLDLSRNLKHEALQVRATRLDLKTQGSKSLQNNFYNTNTKITLSHQMAGTVDSVSLAASYGADHNPLGAGNYLKNVTRIEGDMKLRFESGPFSAVTLGADYAGSVNRFGAAAGALATNSRENGVGARVISDGDIGGGAFRLGVWGDAASPNAFNGSYRRLAGLFGYARDFMVASHQAISIEALAGGGRAWGTIPEYDKFFGGNSVKNFLYESADSQILSAVPAGPLLRSLGTGQGTAGGGISPLGGTSYWNFNLNVGIPIPKWSRPLIPDITIDGLIKTDANCKVVFDSDGNPIPEDRTLGQILKSQGGCSKNTLSKIFKKQGLSPSDAQAKAEKELKSINSILGFLADRANLISVKPLLLFDAARIYAASIPSGHTRYGVGGGIQLTVVIAKFEAGYMTGIRRYPGDPPGNFVARVVFQNLF